MGLRLRFGVQGNQRAQYPLIREYALNYKGPHIMIYAIFLNEAVLGSLGNPKALNLMNMALCETRAPRISRIFDGLGFRV